jgi:hypothetical protein
MSYAQWGGPKAGEMITSLGLPSLLTSTQRLFVKRTHLAAGVTASESISAHDSYARAVFFGVPQPPGLFVRGVDRCQGRQSGRTALS